MDVGARAKSVPVNPWYSERARTECLLQASRPPTLPFEGDEPRPPIQSALGAACPPRRVSEMPTGKGRGVQTAGEMPAEGRPTVLGHGSLRTEGRLPDGDVNGLGSPKDDEKTEELQRALEVELVNYLRGENSKLSEEVALLRRQLNARAAGDKASSGVESSPWSAVEAVGSTGSSGTVKASPTERPGRHGSRTHRNKQRDGAVSPGNDRSQNRFTPGGTKVPDGPPPIDDVFMPPAPPIPMVADSRDGEAQFCSSFLSGLYDTCESKPRNKLGDLQWKPQELRGNDVLSPSEAKQLWLEREVQSLRMALDKVAVPPPIQRSDYWNGNLDSGMPCSRGPSGVESTAHCLDGRNLRDGCGEDQLQDRAKHGGCGTVPHQGRAAIGGSGVDALRDRADAATLQVPGHHRASQMPGELPDQDRAWLLGWAGLLYLDGTVVSA